MFAALEAAEICACASLLRCIYSAQLCSSGEILCNSFLKEAICDIGNITAPYNIGNNGLQDFAHLANYIDFCLYGIYLFRLAYSDLESDLLIPSQYLHVSDVSLCLSLA